MEARVPALLVKILGRLHISEWMPCVYCNDAEMNNVVGVARSQPIRLTNPSHMI